MKFVVRTYDDPEKLGLRSELTEAHLRYLADHEAEILVAGSLRESPDGNPTGGLWIIDTSTSARARELVEGDPFYRGGLRQTYELLHWSKAFSHPASV